MLSDYDKKDISEAYYEAGHEDGYEQGKAETARAMLAEGIAVPVIARCTGLSEDEIAQLALVYSDGNS